MKKLSVTVLAVAALSVFLISADSSTHGISSAFAAADKDLNAEILDVSYEDARKTILDHGWQPFENMKPDDLVFSSKDMYDKGYVEVDVCAPTGVMPCKFFFKNEDGGYLQILTQGEIPHVKSVDLIDAEAFKALNLEKEEDL